MTTDTRKTIAVVGGGPLTAPAIARRFGREGFRVALVDHRQDELESQIAALVAAGIEARGIFGHAFQLDEMVRAFADIKETFGPVDVLVYTPVPARVVQPSEITLEDAREIFECQVIRPINCVRQVLPDMLARGEGSILLANGRSASTTLGLGSVSLGAVALKGFARALHNDLAPRGVQVGIVTVGSRSDESAAADVADVFWNLQESREQNHAVCDGLAELPPDQLWQLFQDTRPKQKTSSAQDTTPDKTKTIAIVGGGPMTAIATALRFGREGFRVALIDSRQGELEKQITVLAAKGIEARGFAGQAFRLEEMVRTFADIKEAFGAVDVMAYTPVYTSSARPDEITLEDARKIFERQTVHAIHCVRQVLPDMLARGEGTILLSNSRGVGRPKRFGGSPISSTALLGYGSALRDELAPKGVRVGIVTIDSGHTDKAESWDVANRFWRIHRRRLC